MARTLTRSEDTPPRPALGMNEDMNLLANERSILAFGTSDLKFYRENRETAEEIGLVIDDILNSVRNAHPGETRDSYSNEDWRPRFPQIAELNELLGRKGS